MIFLEPVHSNEIISNQSANQFLNSHPNRPKRSNDGLFEEDQDPNYQRECVEEDCSYLEINEIITKKWTGREELFREMYDPALIAKTNINKPVFTIDNNEEEFYKQAITDLNNILYEPCKYYHPMQKDFYSKDYFTAGQDIRLCDQASICTTVSNKKKTKNCQCKKSQDLHIRKGNFCEECHEDCYVSGGSCQLNEENPADPEWSCQCPKLNITTTNGIVKVDKFKIYSEHSKFGFCSKPIDYCGNYMSNCDDETTECENTHDGYRCSCREKYVPDGEYDCRRSSSERKTLFKFVIIVAFVFTYL